MKINVTVVTLVLYRTQQKTQKYSDVFSIYRRLLISDIPY